MGLLRGDFPTKKETPVLEPVAYGTRELIDPSLKAKILDGKLSQPSYGQRSDTPGSLLSIVQSSLGTAHKERRENRQILQLMPKVAKAARLMVASILSPNDLTRHAITVTIKEDAIPEAQRDQVTKICTDFFQDRLKLKTELAKWIYSFGYEDGAAVFAVIPQHSIANIADELYVGQESFVSKVLTPIAQETLFGFGDIKDQRPLSAVAMEGLFTLPESASSTEQPVSRLLNTIFGQEALSLTDNPGVLQVRHTQQTKRKAKVAQKLTQRYRSLSEPYIDMTGYVQEDKTFVGNPLLMRLPTDSVTPLYTPGSPDDHQGYLVLLDYQGNPVNSLLYQDTALDKLNSAKQDIFSQVYSAYGTTAGNTDVQKAEINGRIYSQVVAKHLEKRLSDAGCGDTAITNMDAVMRCLFARFLQDKQTRVLFLPKELVTYMTFDIGENGLGVSALDGIKFNASLKMTVQVSRVMAQLKAAMDKRKIEINFGGELREPPEMIMRTVMREYVNKNTMSFSVDPSATQSQIVEKALSIKGTGMPGLDSFDINNEQDSRSSATDFDSDMMSSLDDEIIAGLDVPAATMNSLSQDEYARSVTTTNLFFAMDVSIKQDTTIRCVSDLLRKYARFSKPFHEELEKVWPSLNKTKSKIAQDGEAAVPKKDSDDLPSTITLDTLIDHLTIELPSPNVAPSKAQFDALDSMVESIGKLMAVMMPDDIVVNDQLKPIYQQMRSRATIDNIRTYIESSGMSNLSIPTTDFASFYSDMLDLHDALENAKKMQEARDKETGLTSNPDSPDMGGMGDQSDPSLVSPDYDDASPVPDEPEDANDQTPTDTPQSSDDGQSDDLSSPDYSV
jgi:hypothetical protein